MLLHKQQRARFPIIKRYVVYTKTAANLIKLQWFPSGVLQGHLAMLDVTLISSAEAEPTSCGKPLPALALTYQTFQLGRSLFKASHWHLRVAKKTNVRRENSMQVPAVLTGCRVLNCAPYLRVPAIWHPQPVPAPGTPLSGRLWWGGGRGPEGRHHTFFSKSSIRCSRLLEYQWQEFLSLLSQVE